MIFNLQRYSTHDGPGIRSVVFLKGCSLSCRWCQNPESRSHKPDVLFDSRRCLSGCELCQQTYPQAIQRVDEQIEISRQRLDKEDIQALTERCPSGALTVCGSPIDIDATMVTLLRDMPFYRRSGGGITLSGGEPFMQPYVAAELLQRCHQLGIHTAVESCLHTPWHYIAPSLPWLDLMLADLKHTDENRFRQWTGGSAKLNPSTLDNPRDREKLMMMLRTFFEEYLGWHVQYNIVSRETLLEAKQHPDRYRDLVVRVAGYSAFFTALSPDAQDDIIARTEHTL